MSLVQTNYPHFVYPFEKHYNSSKWKDHSKFMDTWSKPKPFKNQDYYKLRREITNLFEDPLFPADDSSIGYNYLRENRDKFPDGIIWLRPYEACQNPKFVSKDFTKFNLDQGLLGNCWFISALYSLSKIPKLLARIIPIDDNKKSYNGMFHFRFFVGKEWVDVVIDDRLPFYPDGRFIFCYNKNLPNEFWAALLEKAYAKLFGSYENLDVNTPVAALRSLTGAEFESLDVKQCVQSNGVFANVFWKYLLHKFSKLPLMTCTTNPDPYQRELIQPNGLIKGHAYSITNFTTIEPNINLIKLKNPWGDKSQYIGAWSKNSNEWDLVNKSKKKRLLENNQEGEFWISYTDFLKYIDYVQICINEN